MITIETHIISVIKSIKSKMQRADESTISDYTLRNFETYVSKSDIVERIEILLKYNTIINKQFNGKISYKINEKDTTYHVDLQNTNESNNNTDNTSGSNVNNNLEFLNSPASPMQLATPLLTTKHCDSEIIAFKEQTERHNIEIQALKAFFKEQGYILKKSFEELANPVNNNESLISELNDQLKYLKEHNKNKTEIIKVLTENIDKHLLSHVKFVTISNSKIRNSCETRNDSLRSPNRFQIFASANTDNCDKLVANEIVNIQSSNNTFQGHPLQILEKTTSSTTANEPPLDINQTNTAFHNSNHHNGNDTTRKTRKIRTDRNNPRKNNSFNKESTNNDQNVKPKGIIAIVGDSMAKNI